MKKRRLLTQEEFERAAAGAEMEAKTLRLAHQVLVEGRRQVTVAAEEGYSRAWLSELVARFYERVMTLERTHLPEDWIVDTVCLPKELWPKVRDLERDARARLTSSSA
jgi:hypothetical protein